MSNFESLTNRRDEHLAIITSLETHVYDGDAPPTVSAPEAKAAFNDMIGEADRAGQDHNLRLSIFRGGGPGAYRYATTPHSMVTRLANSVLKVRLSTSGNGTPLTYFTSEELAAEYSHWVSGILTVSRTTMGANAGMLTIGSSRVTVHLVPGEDPIVNLTIDIGGSGGPKEVMRVEEAVARLGCEWVPVEGRAAVDPTRPMREIFGGFNIERAEEITLRVEALHGNDRMLKSAMEEINITPRGIDYVKVGCVAGYILCAWDRASEYEAAVLCLGEYAKELGSNGQGGGQGDEAAAAAGARLLATFATVVAALGSNSVRKIAQQIEAADALGMPRMCGAVFGALVAELMAKQPPPPIDSSPEAARLAGYRKQAGEGGTGPMPRPDGGANLFGSGEGTTHNHPGCRAGAFGALVPTCEPRATVKQTIERLGGEAIVADLRAWAGVRADTGHAFDLMSEQSLLYAEEDYKVLEELALGPIGERPAVPNPESWDAASGRLQRVVTGALSNLAKKGASSSSTAVGGGAGVLGTKFRAPRSSTVELSKASEAKQYAAVSAAVLMPLVRPETILALHAKSQAIDAMPEASKPDGLSIMRELHDDSETGKAHRALFVSNSCYVGDLPEKGEIAIIGVTAKAAASDALRATIEGFLGATLAESQHTNVTKMLSQITTFKVEVEMCVSILGAEASLDEDMGTEGRLGTTTGPTATADMERAFTRLAKLWTTYGGRALGVDVSVEHFGAPILVQQCRELSDDGRVEVMAHALSAVARQAALMRQSAAAPLLDISACFLTTRTVKLARTRALEEARAAGREGAKDASVGAKRKGESSATGAGERRTARSTASQRSTPHTRVHPRGHTPHSQASPELPAHVRVRSPAKPRASPPRPSQQ